MTHRACLFEVALVPTWTFPRYQFKTSLMQWWELFGQNQGVVQIDIYHRIREILKYFWNNSSWVFGMCLSHHRDPWTLHHTTICNNWPQLPSYPHHSCGFRFGENPSWGQLMKLSGAWTIVMNISWFPGRVELFLFSPIPDHVIYKYAKGPIRFLKKSWKTRRDGGCASSNLSIWWSMFWTACDTFESFAWKIDLLWSRTPISTKLFLWISLSFANASKS